jgi:hypothetical protein
MSTPRFLADENIESALVSGTLRLEAAIEFQTLAESGLLGASDEMVLEFARGESLIVVSHDVNTMIGSAKARIASGSGISGLLLVPTDASVHPIAESLVMIWAASSAEEWADRIVFLPL